MRLAGLHRSKTVRIDRPSGLDIYDTPARDKAQRLDAPGGRGAQRQVGDDVVISTPPQRYVREALAAEDVDLAAIAEAKRLIASGQLDTPEAVKRAAEAIVELGI